MNRHEELIKSHIYDVEVAFNKAAEIAFKDYFGEPKENSARYSDRCNVNCHQDGKRQFVIDGFVMVEMTGNIADGVNIKRYEYGDVKDDTFI